jgi:hypothetical protein
LTTLLTDDSFCFFFIIERYLPLIMLLRFTVALFFILLLCKCSQRKQLPNTDIEVARSFIDAVKQGHFNDASDLMLKDEANNEALKKMEEDQSHSIPKEDLEKYKASDIIIGEITPVENNSVTIITYSNSYNSENKSKVKVVKVNGQWLIDLKYTFAGDM